MKWEWPKWLGVIAAGLAGPAIFTTAFRVAGDTSLLINSDVIGAAIGASLTIAGTLAIDAGRRNADARRKMYELCRSLKALKGVAETANREVDMTLPLHDRAIEAATFLGALGGGREMMLYARGRIDIEDVGLWLKLETLDRNFTRFDKQRESDKVALSRPTITELDWTTARARMKDFNKDVIKSLEEIITIIERKN